MSLKVTLELYALKILSRIRRLIIGKYSIAVLYSTDNGLLMVNADDLVVGRYLAYRGAHDSGALQTLSGLITDQSSVCVIGAHVGSLLIPLAKKAQKAVGFEANPETFKLLALNVQLNELDNTSIYNCAVGDRRREVEFYANTINSGGSKIKPTRDHFAYTYDAPEIIKVEMIALDEHSAAEFEFDVIVMDIEGSEYMALQGMQKTIKHCKHLQIEYDPHHLKHVSGVTNEEFLALFSRYFEYVRVVGSSGVHPRAEFLPLLNRLTASGARADLLFSRGDVRDRPRGS